MAKSSKREVANVEIKLQTHPDHSVSKERENKVTLRRHVVNSHKESYRQNKKNKIDGAETVVGRESEYSCILKQIQSFHKYEQSCILYITGVPGSGKTFTTLSLLNYLEYDYNYLNCATLNSKNEVFKEICASSPCLRNLGGNISILRNHFSNCDKKHILVIDEVDFLFTKNEKIIYNLFELPFIEHSKVMLIVISNTLGNLSTKVESRIGKNRMEFKPYSALQLQEVIKADLKKKHVQADEKTLELISKRIAASTGDIRKMKEVVEREEKITLATIGTLLRDMNTPLLNKFIISLNIYQKILIFCHKSPSKTIANWYDDFKVFCRMKDIKCLEYFDFLFVVDQLVDYGIYKIRKDGVEAVLCYLEEEIDQAVKNDADFKSFREFSVKNN